MCNLYSMTKAPAAIASLFRVPHNRQQQFDPLPAIFPGWSAPVVRQAADGDRELLMMSWDLCCCRTARRRGASPTPAMTKCKAGSGARHSSSVDASFRPLLL